jgi:YD repeat-containing protein
MQHTSAQGIAEYTYDAFGFLTKETFTTGASVNTREYIQSANELTTTQTDFDGVVTTIVYDIHGAIVSSSCTEPNGTVSNWRFIYDGNGNNVSITDPSNNVTALTYDNRDRLIQVHRSNGDVTYAYDVDGTLTSVIQDDGTGSPQTTTFSITADHNTATMTLPAVPLPDGSSGTWQPTVSKDFQPNECVKAIRQDILPGSQTNITLGLDARGRLNTVTRDLGFGTFTATQQFDEFGNIESSTNATFTAALRRFRRPVPIPRSCPRKRRPPPRNWAIPTTAAIG